MSLFAVISNVFPIIYRPYKNISVDELHRHIAQRILLVYQAQF